MSQLGNFSLFVGVQVAEEGELLVGGFQAALDLVDAGRAVGLEEACVEVIDIVQCTAQHQQQQCDFHTSLIAYAPTSPQCQSAPAGSPDTLSLGDSGCRSRPGKCVAANPA